MYPTCVIDWYSRYVVGWRLASDMGAAGVCECVSRAFDEHVCLIASELRV